MRATKILMKFKTAINFQAVNTSTNNNKCGDKQQVANKIKKIKTERPNTEKEKRRENKTDYNNSE